MTRNIAAALIAIVALSTPAFAATEYYVAKAEGKGCEIVTTKPDGKSMMMVGKEAHKTDADAKKAMEASAECKK